MARFKAMIPGEHMPPVTLIVESKPGSPASEVEDIHENLIHAAQEGEQHLVARRGERKPAPRCRPFLEGLPAKPLYVQLDEILRARIASGEWNPGERIPSENELNKAFGLSRMTVCGGS